MCSSPPSAPRRAALPARPMPYTLYPPSPPAGLRPLALPHRCWGLGLVCDLQARLASVSPLSTRRSRVQGLGSQVLSLWPKPPCPEISWMRRRSSCWTARAVAARAIRRGVRTRTGRRAWTTAGTWPPPRRCVINPSTAQVIRPPKPYTLMFHTACLDHGWDLAAAKEVRRKPSQGSAHTPPKPYTLMFHKLRADLRQRPASGACSSGRARQSGRRGGGALRAGPS